MSLPIIVSYTDLCENILNIASNLSTFVLITHITYSDIFLLLYDNYINIFFYIYFKIIYAVNYIENYSSIKIFFQFIIHNYIFMFIILIFLINFALSIISTLIIAAITLLERKLLSIIQRRVGPNFVGYRGRLQYLADALKLIFKNTLIPRESNNFLFITAPSIICSICYFFWVNSIWGSNLSILELEYNLVYVSILSILFSFCIILSGYFSKNKYSLLGSVRSLVLVINLEIFIGLMIINLVIFVESFSFNSFVVYQETQWFCFTFFNLLSLIFITFLLETNRAPFDLPEAESELVGGYHTEYGGFLFALYYLGEYFHLFFFSAVIAILFFGGWEFPNILTYILYSDINMQFDILKTVPFLFNDYVDFYLNELQAIPRSLGRVKCLFLTWKVKIKLWSLFLLKIFLSMLWAIQFSFWKLVEDFTHIYTFSLGILNNTLENFLNSAIACRDLYFLNDIYTEKTFLNLTQRSGSRRARKESYLTARFMKIKFISIITRDSDSTFLYPLSNHWLLTSLQNDILICNNYEVNYFNGEIFNLFFDLSVELNLKNGPEQKLSYDYNTELITRISDYICTPFYIILH